MSEIAAAHPRSRATGHPRRRCIKTEAGRSEVLIPKTRPSFVGTGLLSDSVIMLDKLATVEKSLIVRILGEVDNDLKAEINLILAECYRL